MRHHPLGISAQLLANEHRHAPQPPCLYTLGDCLCAVAFGVLIGFFLLSTLIP